MLSQLGRYRIEELIGEGTFARVYRAVDVELERQVALKVLKSVWLSDPAAIARFKQEARTMARLDKNPHIAIVYEVGEDQGQVYLAQLLVDGETLTDRLTRGPLAWPEALDILRDIATALDYAHSQGVIHRDIKPSNILLDKDGQTYLGDFGLVRAAEGSASLSRSIGGVKGTASYIPPEVWDGEEATPASDVYALICVIFEMLTGQVLFEGSSMMQVMRKHDQGPQFPAIWSPDVPAGVTEVLQRGLAKKPAERFSRAGELVKALAALSASPQAEPIVVPPTTKAEPEAAKPELPPPSRPNVSPVTVPPARAMATGGWMANKGLLLGGGVAVLLAICGAISIFVFGGGAAPTREPPSPTLVAKATDTPTTPTPLPPTITTSDGATMLLIPSGPFEMGSDKGTNDEKPIHTVVLDTFYLDQTEVTNVQYARCVAAGGCTPPAQTRSYTRDSYYSNHQFDNYPVIYVTWEQAKTYCEWRKARLPTEAEWEKAARGTDGRIYPWGDKFDGRKLNFCDKNCPAGWANKDFDDGYADTAPVGSYPNGASPYGVDDLAGNVWEWVADWYAVYPAEAQTNPTGPTSGSHQVLRGGSWYYYAFNTRVSYRIHLAPSYANDYIGFRCAR